MKFSCFLRSCCLVRTVMSWWAWWKTSAVTTARWLMACACWIALSLTSLGQQSFCCHHHGSNTARFLRLCIHGGLLQLLHKCCWRSFSLRFAPQGPEHASFRVCTSCRLVVCRRELCTTYVTNRWAGGRSDTQPTVGRSHGRADGQRTWVSGGRTDGRNTRCPPFQTVGVRGSGSVKPSPLRSRESAQCTGRGRDQPWAWAGRKVKKSKKMLLVLCRARDMARHKRWNDKMFWTHKFNLTWATRVQCEKVFCSHSPSTPWELKVAGKRKTIYWTR